MELFLPVAGVSVNVFLIIGLGGIVGFLSGLFGVGGGFLLTPLLMMLSIPPTVAAASDANQIVAASTSGAYAHYKEGNVDVKLGLYMLLGGIIGGTIGTYIIKILRHMGNVDFVIKVFYVALLGIIGFFMLLESLKLLKGSGEEGIERPSILNKWMSKLPFQIEFEKSKIKISLLAPVILGVAVGILAAIMGVGGGFILIPVMVYGLGMSMNVVIGTSLFQILFTSANVTLMQSMINHNVDILLAVILLFGSSIGAQVGAKVGKRLNSDQLKLLLAIIVLVVAAKMLTEIMIKPVHILSYKGGH